MYYLKILFSHKLFDEFKTAKLYLVYLFFLYSKKKLILSSAYSAIKHGDKIKIVFFLKSHDFYGNGNINKF